MDVLVSASPTFVFYLQPKFGDNFFFSIHSYPQFDFSEILGLLCPGSSIWFYLHHIDFRTGRRSPKCCWCFIAASLSQGVFATTEILTFTSKHWKKSIVFFFDKFALFWSSFQKHGKPCAINWNNRNHIPWWYNFALGKILWQIVFNNFQNFGFSLFEVYVWALQLVAHAINTRF